MLGPSFKAKAYFMAKIDVSIDTAYSQVKFCNVQKSLRKIKSRHDIS